jgi:hypothetical protein
MNPEDANDIDVENSSSSGVEENAVVWEEEFAFETSASSSTRCRQCDGNIVKGCLRVRHLRQIQRGSTYVNKPYYYHLPCWHACSEHKPDKIIRPLSTYFLFDALPPHVQKAVLDSHDIFEFMTVLLLTRDLRRRKRTTRRERKGRTNDQSGEDTTSLASKNRKS